jgi:non-specific serine/threonine protein kinase
LWRRLSVFAGGFGLEAAEDVCAGAGLERERIVDLVGILVAKSILTMEHGGRRGRYRLLETLRLYGAQRLVETGEEVWLARQHAAWYAKRFSGGDRPWWGTSAQAEVLETLDVEWANVEAALDFLTGSEGNAESGLRMAADLWLYWLVRGRYRAGARHLETFLAMDRTPSPTRAMALWALGFLAQATGDFARSLSACEEARLVCEEPGWDRELAYALFGLGLAHSRLGNIELAADCARRSQERILRVNDPMGLALCLYFLATMVAITGPLPDARRLVNDGLEASERAGDKMARGLLNGLLGTFEWLLGDARAAEARLKEAVQIQDMTGHLWGMFSSLEGLAWLAGSSGQFERAAMLLGASAALREELGIGLLPYGQAHHEACESAVRDGLGEARYRECCEQGYALSRERVVTTALEDTLPADRRAAPAGARHDTDELSERELEVARLVASGLSNPAIAADLFVSVATVKTHVSHILRKLGLQSRVQLAAWVADHDPGSAAPPHR